MTERWIYRSETTPVSFLRRSASVDPDEVAVIHGSRRYSYRQLEERVNRLASSRRGRGLQKSGRVAFLTGGRGHRDSRRAVGRAAQGIRVEKVAIGANLAPVPTVESVWGMATSAVLIAGFQLGIIPRRPA